VLKINHIKRCKLLVKRAIWLRQKYNNNRVFVSKIEYSNIRIFDYSNNWRYSNNTIRIRIPFSYLNIRIFDYSPQIQ